MSEFSQKKCKACEGGVDPLQKEQVEAYLNDLPGWKVSSNGKWISKSWKRKDFSDALSFVNSIGEIAEEENHHPDIGISGYRNVEVQLSTHAIDGLSENDFIVATKIDDV